MVSFAKLLLPEVEDETVSRAIRLLLDRINGIGDVAILSGEQLKDVSLTTSEKSIPHKLGRKPKGYFVTSNDTNTTVKNGTHTNKYLKLTAGAACTVDIWVY